MGLRNCFFEDRKNLAPRRDSYHFLNASRRFARVAHDFPS